MQCEECKGTGRKPYGYVTLLCDCCYGKGKLTVDMVWAVRDSIADATNQMRQFEWRMKWFKFQQKLYEAI